MATQRMVRVFVGGLALCSLAALAQGNNAATIVLSLPDSALADGCASAELPCLREDAGAVDVAISIANPPSQGGYRSCRLEVAAGSNTATPGSDYTLPAGNEGQVRITAQSNWQATLTLTVVADEVEEGTETLSLQGKCGGTVGDTTPSSRRLAGNRAGDPDSRWRQCAAST